MSTPETVPDLDPTELFGRQLASYLEEMKQKIHVMRRNLLCVDEEAHPEMVDDLMIALAHLDLGAIHLGVAAKKTRAAVASE